MKWNLKFTSRLVSTWKVASIADGLKFSFHFILITQISIVTCGLWQSHNVACGYCIRQCWSGQFFSALSDVAQGCFPESSQRQSGICCFAQGSTENLEDKLPAFSLGQRLYILQMCLVGLSNILQPLASNLPDVQAGFRKGRGNRDQMANICWIMEKGREFQKKIYSALLTMPKPLCGSQ